MRLVHNEYFIPLKEKKGEREGEKKMEFNEEDRFSFGKCIFQ